MSYAPWLSIEAIAAEVSKAIIWIGEDRRCVGLACVNIEAGGPQAVVCCAVK